MKKQPAIKSYCFGKGYLDLKNTFVESWQRNLASTVHYGKEAKFFWYYKSWAFWLFIAVGTLFVSVSVFFFWIPLFFPLQPHPFHTSSYCFFVYLPHF